MSTEEKNITVTLWSYVCILIYFIVRWTNMYQTIGLDKATVFGLWATVIASIILVSIIGSILTHIVFAIVHAIKTQSDKVEPMITDERDKMIKLRGQNLGYIIFSIGVFIGMITYVLNQPTLIMFSIIVFFSVFSEIVADVFQLIIYRRGF
jgi:hypothetical protein